MTLNSFSRSTNNLNWLYFKISTIDWYGWTSLSPENTVLVVFLNLKTVQYLKCFGKKSKDGLRYRRKQCTTTGVEP